MKNKILEFIFHRYKDYFGELMVQELMGNTPNDIKEPSLAFLANGKEKLERFFLFQSYYLQRKAVGDLSNAQFYQGAMLYISIFLKVISQGKNKQEITTVISKENDNKEKKVSSAIFELKNYKKKTIDIDKSVVN